MMFLENFIRELKIELDAGETGGRALRIVVERWDEQIRAQAAAQAKKAAERERMRGTRTDLDDEIPF